jgi:hypothetical protein
MGRRLKFWTPTPTPKPTSSRSVDGRKSDHIGLPIHHGSFRSTNGRCDRVDEGPPLAPSLVPAKGQNSLIQRHMSVSRSENSFSS